FFLNYEKYESLSNGRTLTFTPTTGLEDQILARLKQYSSTIPWGDAVTSATSNLQNESKILAKVDWKISDKHRLNVRYSKTDGLVPQFGNLGGGVTINGVSSGQVGASPTGHFYNQTRVGKSYSGQFNSDWTSDFKTEIRFTRNTDVQETPTASTAPLIVINGLSGTDLRNNTAITTGAYVAGTEQFRHGNFINAVNRQFSAKGDYFWKDFVITGGVEREWSDFYNLFRSGSYGLVAFRTVADFLADTNGVISRNYYDPAVRPVADISDFATNSVYGQAKWNVNDRLNFLFGLRVDQTQTSIRPALNQSFLTKTGFHNDGTLDGVMSYAPRLGFNYSLDAKRVTQLRGGYGYFNGRSPWVFFSNSFGNTGVGTFSRSSTDTTNPLTGSLTSYLGTQFDASNPIGSGTDNPTLRREVDFNDNKIKMPAVWRGNLAVDHKLGFLDSTVTVEFIYTKVAEALRTTNENLKPLAGALALDGRARFSGSPGTQANALYTDYTNMYRVSNTTVGSSKYATVSWDRPMKDKWSFNLAYTRGRSTEAQSNSQTTAGGQFLRNVVFNQNAVELGTADYEIKDRFQLTLTRQFEFVKKWKTFASLYYEGRSGNPVSWVFGGDLNGDGQSFNDTVVIPTGSSDPKFDFSGMTTDQQTAFFNLIQSSGLSKYAGQIVPKNSFYEPWVNRLDLNFRQEVPIHGSAKLSLGFDFINFGAFLSKSTFGYTEVAPNQSNDAFRTLTLTSGTSYNAATGQIKPLFTGAGPLNTFVSAPVLIDNLQSRWRIQFSAKLSF
ncbi:MAG: TonB-dependent receptor, partial [bacterium]|nr:TonB-dependent receptor [bacterium]